MGPLVARARRRRGSMASRSVTSHWMAAPSRAMAAVRCSGSMPSSRRGNLRALRRGGAAAVAAPMPVPPPVMSACLPCSQLFSAMLSPFRMKHWPKASGVARRRGKYSMGKPTHEDPRRPRVRSQAAARDRRARPGRAQVRRSAGRDHGDRHLPYRRLHAGWTGQRRAVSVDPRP